MANVIPTPAQVEELGRLEAQVSEDIANRAHKIAAATTAAAALAEAQDVDAKARAELQAADDKESADLAALKEFLVRLFDPVVGIEVVPGDSTPRN